VQIVWTHYWWVLVVAIQKEPVQMVLVLKVWEPTVLVLIESVQRVLMETVLRAQMLLLLI
jgi:hypothetical protein